MQNEFGEDLARLNGFSDEQLSYGDFIDNFVDEAVVADASIDANANVRRKDVVTLLTEMPKPHRKLIAFNKIYYEFQKEYGFKAANDWLRREWVGELYLHDSDTSTFKSYCYKGEELLTVKYDDEIYNLSMQELYNLVPDRYIQFDESIKQNAKFPKNLYVKDLNSSNEVQWTKITRLVEHDNTKKMRFIKMANGLSQIVTEDHPVITERGEVPAREVTETDRCFTIKPDYFDPTESSLNAVLTDGQIRNKFFESQGTFPLTKDLGWIVGMYLSEGNCTSGMVLITQAPGPQLEKLKSICDNYNIKYSLYEKEEGRDERGFAIKACPFAQWIKMNFKEQLSNTKSLPNDYIYYSNEFLDGIVAGMIDGDGTIDGYKNRHCHIRITSEKLCHQLSNYLATQGIFCGDRTPFRYNRKGSFTQNLPMFGIGFTLTNEDYFLNIGSIKVNTLYEPRVRKTGNFANKKYQYNYGWVNIIDNTEYIDECPVVYDITTETGHFICNNILSHNCFAYDLRDLAEKGLFFLGDNFNPKPPKHLTTFVDFVKEFINFASNRTSGAVGLPNLIPYMYYFWKEDMKNGYLGIPSEEYGRTYAKQNIQRFIYAVNQPCVRDGQQSAFTNTSVFDSEYLMALFGGAEFPNGEFMVDHLDGIMEFQKLYMETMSDIRSENMFTFPVSTISMIRKDGHFVDEEFAEWAIKHNMKWSDSNLFIDEDVTSLSNCCRLKSDIRDLGYFNSVGGTALKVGSIKVNTVNLARLALDTSSTEEFFKELEVRTLCAVRALHVVRHIIKRNVEKGLLPNFSYGLIDFKSCYNTLGFIGIYEALKKFGFTYQDKLGNTYYTKEGEDFGERIFKIMRKVADDFIAENEVDYMISMEQIPGENAAAKLMRKDRFFYPNADIYDLPLYGNQFMPLGVKSTLQERVRVQALFDGFCNGGSILHANIDAPFNNYETARKMVEYVADQGVTYFAFNTKIQACADNHGFYGTTCPICGKPIATEYTRVVGFLVPINTWTRERKAEYQLRRWENVNVN